LRALVGVVVAVLAFVVLLGRRHQLAGAGREFDALRIPLVVGAVVAEACTVVAFALLEWRLLASAEVRPGFSRVVRITLGGMALQNSLPAGSAWSSFFAYSQFRRSRASRRVATWVVVAQGILVLLVLAVLTGVVLVATEASPLLAVVVVGLTFLALPPAVRLGHRYLRPPAGSLRRSKPRNVIDTLGSVRPTASGWAFSVAAATASLATDCGCLALSFAAVGQHVPWAALVPAYCVGQLATRVPLSPGGLGLFEGGVTATLAAYGVPATSALGAVLLYRLVSYWALTAVGWLAIASLRS
jgi:uncharacterized membrane protein YbhN (UPF0104 family)